MKTGASFWKLLSLARQDVAELPLRWPKSTCAVLLLSWAIGLPVHAHEIPWCDPGVQSQIQPVSPTVERAILAVQRQVGIQVPVRAGLIARPCLGRTPEMVVVPSEWVAPPEWIGGPTTGRAWPRVAWALYLYRAIRSPRPNDLASPTITASRELGCQLSKWGGASLPRLLEALAEVDPDNGQATAAAAEEGVRSCGR